ncbi:MAG TPA: hypothetical protein ENG01_01320 [Candidatus Aenigmarchaeota archaeon]|nr:hypothetical protein [Candidatus Aenigmarchaeota archaeon]HEX33037.1 hypothetical protein [Candidatus Aenigmarchaeota archaeon]
MRVVLAVVLLFMITQALSIFVSLHYQDNLPYNISRPTEKDAATSVIIGLLCGTIIVLLLIKYNLISVIKVWIFLVLWFVSSVTLNLFVDGAAVMSAFFITFLAMFEPEIMNIVLVIALSGLTAIIAPVFSTSSALLLLGAISIYDVYAVFVSKHMLKMATKLRNIMGFNIGKPGTQYGTGKRVGAFLGNGDVVFASIMSAVLAIKNIYLGTLNLALTTITILLMFMYMKRPMPAMPFITLASVPAVILSFV